MLPARAPRLDARRPGPCVGDARGLDRRRARHLPRAAAAAPAAQATAAAPAQQPAASAAEEQRQASVLAGLSAWAAQQLPRFTPPASQQWQPSDLLPDSASPFFLQQLEELREEAGRLPADVVVVLAGLAVVAATAPNELSRWCGTPGLRDDSGADGHPWARWRRRWAADRNRHRQSLLGYLYASGCVDTQALDATMQQSIGEGCEAGGGAGSPYQQLARGVLQGAMSRVLHSNLSSIAAYHRAAGLARLAAAIAVDEERHEMAQAAAVTQVFAADPGAACLALAQVVREGVVLPGCRMDDGWHEDKNSSGGGGGGSSTSTSQGASAGAGAGAAGLQGGVVLQPQGAAAGGRCSALYLDFMAAADALGAHTPLDSAAAVEQCCALWQVADLAAPASGQPRAVRDAARRLLEYPDAARRLAELQLEGRLRARRRERSRSAFFSWVFRREVPLS